MRDEKKTKCGGWIAGQDEFGTWAKFNYKEEAGFGTVIGGMCSLCLTAISAMFVFIQMYGWAFQASYNNS